MASKNELVKFSLTAVIPTAQYANLQPVIETQGNSYEEAQELALSRMAELWNRVCEPGKEMKVAQKVASTTTDTNSYDNVVSDLTGVEVLFDKVAHKYMDSNGRSYLSGSVFSGMYKEKFNADMIGGKVAVNAKLPKSEVLDMWSLNAEASTCLGSAIHNALELYGKYLSTSMAVKGNSDSALHKNELLRPVVEKFFKGRENEDALYEAFVADDEDRICGYIDRLLIVDREKKICRVQDYKTNPDIFKKERVKEPFKGVVDNSSLGVYRLQLSFYAYILQKHGWTVEGLDIFNYEGGEWKTYSSDVVDVSAEIKLKKEN